MTISVFARQTCEKDEERCCFVEEFQFFDVVVHVEQHPVRDAVQRAKPNARDIGARVMSEWAAAHEPGHVCRQSVVQVPSRSLGERRENNGLWRDSIEQQESERPEYKNFGFARSRTGEYPERQPITKNGVDLLGVRCVVLEGFEGREKIGPIRHSSRYAAPGCAARSRQAVRPARAGVRARVRRMRVPAKKPRIAGPSSVGARRMEAWLATTPIRKSHHLAVHCEAAGSDDRALVSANQLAVVQARMRVWPRAGGQF